MSFLLVNGWRVPAFNETPERTFAQHGELSAGWMNRPIRNRRGLPSTWAARMAVMERADADTLEGLLMGVGHHFPLNTDAFSSNGLGPEGGGGYTMPVRTPTAGVHGFGYLNVSTSIVWDTKLPADAWAVAYWRNVTTTPQHIVVRADGAKFLNGVRADATATPELVVDGGAVAFTTGTYDDVVAWPFLASDAFIAAFYRWTTGKEIQWHLPLDGFESEVLNRGVSVFDSANVVWTRGQIARARQFAVGGRIRLTGTKLQVFGTTEASWECWFNWRSFLTPGPSFAYIMSRFGAGGEGHSIWINTTGFFANRLEANIRTTSGLVGVVSQVGVAIPKDAWHHLVVTWTQATGAMTMWLNGVNIGQANGVLPGAPPSNDVGLTTSIGNNVLASQVFGGDLDDVRGYRRALTAAEVWDHYQAGRHNIRPPVLQPATFPQLAVDGGIVEWRQTTVLGDAGDAPYAQHGGTGWRNNSATPSVTLDEVQDRELGVIPSPHAQWILAERYEETAGVLRCAAGGFADAARAGGLFGIGPFDVERAWFPQGPPTGQVDLPAAVAGSVGGARFLTVLAWVRRASIGSQHTVLIHERAAGNVKVRLDVTAGNLVRIGARASAADAAEVQRSSVVTFTDLTTWHLVGGIVDLLNNRLATVFDVTVDEGAATFATNVFTVESGPIHRVGLDNAGANRWNGGIASVAWWTRRLSIGEIRAVFNAGRSGVFR